MPQPNRPHQSDVPRKVAAFDLSRPVRFPFEIGQVVAHRAASDSRGIVTELMFTPAGCQVGVSWGPGSDEPVHHFVLERHYTDEGEEACAPSQSHDLPFKWGDRVKHRAKRERGVVTGYRLFERGAMVRVVWGAETWDWYHLCELEAEEVD